MRAVCAGQAVVQFGAHTVSKLVYAIKVFVAEAAFKAESSQYANSLLLRLLPKLHAIIDNSDATFKDAFGRKLPPCIVMERGGSLDLWVQRNKQAMDMFTCMQVSTAARDH
jgi:hypothetical protein